MQILEAEKGVRTGAFFAVIGLVSVAVSCRTGERSSIGITVSPTQGVGRTDLLKPLQQRFCLRMVGEIDRLDVDGNRDRGMAQDFQWITGFQIALANTWLAGELPPGNDVVQERIVECLRDLVAQAGYILKITSEKSRRNPARIDGHPAGLGRAAGIKEVSMEPKHAATGRNAAAVDAKQESVGQEQYIETIGGELTGVDLIVDHNGQNDLIKEQVQHEDNSLIIRRR